MRDGDDRVVAIMMKAPRAGRVKTRLASKFAPELIVPLYRALVEDTIELVRSLGPRTVAVCPAGDEAELERWLGDRVEVRPQGGSGLAAGLAWTFEQLCTPPGRRAVAFNADSPHLAPELLASAFDRLRDHDLVVGPTDDGGYYLVGASRPHSGLFEAATMGKQSALAALMARSARLGLRASVIAPHYDVDLPEDVVRLAAELAERPERARRTAAVLAAWRADAGHAQA